MNTKLTRALAEFTLGNEQSQTSSLDHFLSLGFNTLGCLQQQSRSNSAEVFTTTVKVLQQLQTGQFRTEFPLGQIL